MNVFAGITLVVVADLSIAWLCFRLLPSRALAAVVCWLVAVVPISLLITSYASASSLSEGAFVAPLATAFGVPTVTIVVVKVVDDRRR